MAEDTRQGSIPYGQRLIPPLIDERAQAGHVRPFASIPVSANAEDGFRDISYQVLANAINRCAHWLRDMSGLSGAQDTTLTYIGPQDFRYLILIVAAAKAGFVMFFPSPRNNEETFMSLLDQADTTTIITGAEPIPVVTKLIQDRGMRHFLLVGLDVILSEELVQPIPWTGTFEEYRMRPLLKLHTSGSTGMPKVIPIKHGLAAAHDAYSLLRENDVAKRMARMRIFSPFPLFHIAGFLMALPTTCWIDSTVVFPPVAPLSASLVNAVHVNATVEYSLLAPSLVDDICKTPEYLENLRRLSGLNYAGGPLSDATASLVSKRTKLATSLGATEYAGIPLMSKDSEDWAYLRFDTEGAGLEFRETDQPGLYELVFVRDERKTLNQPVFVTFPDLQEYSTKDCFTKHPTKPGLWKYATRLDDLIVFSNGEKINPVAMEGIITANVAIKSCLVIGQGKFQTGLIVESAKPDMSLKEMNEVIWPDVQRANQVVPKYGRIARECIFLAEPDKPFPRAAKGTVQRARAYALYEPEINELYRNVEVIMDKADHQELDLRSPHTTEQSVKAYINNDLDLEDIGLDDDFFKFGMDSLQLIGLVRAMNNAMGQARVDQKQVYENSTVRKLARVLYEGAPDQEDEDYDDFESDDETDKATWTTMQDVFKDISATLPGSHEAEKHRNKNILKSTLPSPLFHPDGGTTAWLQVLASFLINVNNWGLVNSFGVYQAFYSTNILSTYSASTISWIGTLEGSLLLIVGVISGPLFDKGYCRAITIAGSIGVVFALMMLSLSAQYYQIILSQGFLTGLCLGLLYIPSVALVPLYFKKKRGLALGLATSGGSFGGVLYPIVFRRLLSTIGFAWATRVTGFIALATLTVAILLLKPIGARTSRQLIDLTAFKEPPYTAFTASGFLLFAGVLVPFFLTTTYAATSLQTTPDLAFYTLSILNAAQLVGRILPAIASDYIGPELLLLGAMLGCAIVAFCWIAVTSTAGYVVWLIVYGFGSGMVVTLPAAVLPFVSPSLAVIGTRLGMLYALGGVGFLVSTPIAGALAGRTPARDGERGGDRSGYLGAQVWVGGCCVAAAMMYSITCLEAWRRRRLYERRRKRKGRRNWSGSAVGGAWAGLSRAGSRRGSVKRKARVGGIDVETNGIGKEGKGEVDEKNSAGNSGV